MSLWQSLLAALSFMTRLAPTPRGEVKDFYRTVPLFPVVGLILGALLAAPFALGLLAGRPYVAAWLLAAANLYLTRGLHYDGFSDLFDAWGSLASKERFFEIMKDSRVGAFGALGLIFGVAGQIVLFAALLSSGNYGAIVWGCVFGRGLCVLLMRLGRAHLRPGLGSMFLPGATGGALFAAMSLTLVFGLSLVDARTLVLSLLCGAPGLVALLGLARKNEGLNGDFLGACIVYGELAACLAAVL